MDAPGEVRRTVPFKRLALTDLKVNIPRLAKKSVLTKALEDAGGCRWWITLHACLPVVEASPTASAGHDHFYARFPRVCVCCVANAVCMRIGVWHETTHASIMLLPWCLLGMWGIACGCARAAAFCVFSFCLSSLDESSSSRKELQRISRQYTNSKQQIHMHAPGEEEALAGSETAAWAVAACGLVGETCSSTILAHSWCCVSPAGTCTALLAMPGMLTDRERCKAGQKQ